MPKGGKRDKAGRPPVPLETKKVPLTVKITPKYRDWLRAQDKAQGVLIEEALAAKYDI